MDTPYEAYPKKTLYVRAMDLEDDTAFELLINNVLGGMYWYIHFGIVCSSWGAAGRLSGGTRRTWGIYGAPTSTREHNANGQAARCTCLILALLAVGGFFSVENPADSLLWASCYMEEVRRCCDWSFVVFDQCRFGLRPPGAGLHDFTRKRTGFFTNLVGATILERSCCGTHARHHHVHAWGSVKVRGVTVNRAQAAGAYPPSLCAAIANVVWHNYMQVR